MPESALLEPDPRVGSAWLADATADDRDAVLVALLSRFNHDLRTPLNTVVGWTHLLQKGAVDNARSRHVADVLARNAREQTVLLDEFVDDARAVLGVLKIESVQLALDELIAGALERAAPLFTLHGVSASPSIAAGASVHGDARRLARLLYRLLAAATKRAQEGNAVDVSLNRSEGQLQWRVSAPCTTSDWPEALLLDLRISAFIAALHGFEVVADRSHSRATIVLRMPRSA